MDEVLAEEDVVLAFWGREERVNSSQSRSGPERLRVLLTRQNRVAFPSPPVPDGAPVLPVAWSIVGILHLEQGLTTFSSKESDVIDPRHLRPPAAPLRRDSAGTGPSGSVNCCF